MRGIDIVVAIGIGIGVMVLFYILQQGYNQKEADRTGAAVAKAIKASDAASSASGSEVLTSSVSGPKRLLRHPMRAKSFAGATRAARSMKRSSTDANRSWTPRPQGIPR